MGKHKKKRKYSFALTCKDCRFRYQCGEPSHVKILRCLKHENGKPSKSEKFPDFSLYFREN